MTDEVALYLCGKTEGESKHPNHCVGPKQEITFGGQSTFILPVGDQFIFMADVWRPKHPSDARYIWLPITFENGKPTLHWREEWDIASFLTKK